MTLAKYLIMDAPTFLISLSILVADLWLKRVFNPLFPYLGDLL